MRLTPRWKCTDAMLSSRTFRVRRRLPVVASRIAAFEGFASTAAELVPPIDASGFAEAARRVLTDRATWISFQNRGDFKIHVEGDKTLFNQYGVTLVNPARHPRVKAEAGQAFIDWILSPEGQAAIASYKLGGLQLFFPNPNSR